MFNVTGGEVLIILVIALIVLGPEKLPDMIRKAGRLYGELRRMSNGFQSELRDAFEEPTRELRETANLARNAVTGAMTDLTTSVNEIVRPDLSAMTAESGPQFGSAAPAEPANGDAVNPDLAVNPDPAVNPDLAAAIAAEAAEASGADVGASATEPLVGAVSSVVATNGSGEVHAPTTGAAAMAPPSAAVLSVPAPAAPPFAAGLNGVNGHGALAPPALPVQFAPPRPLPLPAVNGAGAQAAETDERQPVGLQPPMAPPGGQ